MDAKEILRSLGIGLSRALRYLFPSFMLVIAFALADSSQAKTLYDTMGWQLLTLSAIVIGVGVYAMHRSFIIPCHHLLGCFILWIGDIVARVEPRNSLSPTRWFGSLTTPVPRGRRMIAYNDLRLW